MLPGNQNVEFKEGKTYSDLIRALLKNVDREKMFIQSKVVSVSPIGGEGNSEEG